MSAQIEGSNRPIHASPSAEERAIVRQRYLAQVFLSLGAVKDGAGDKQARAEKSAAKVCFRQDEGKLRILVAVKPLPNTP